MTREEAIRKMEFCKNAYQKLIDEEVDNGTFVGTGVNGVWKADTPLTKAYSDMVDACDMAIKALEQEPREITLDDVKGYCMPRSLTIITNELLYELTHPKIKALEQEPILDKIRSEIARLRDSWEKDNYHDEADALTTALAILDKYKVQEGKA